MKLNKIILKAINEGIEKSLLQFDDGEIEFNKSNNSIQTNQQKIKDRLYGFDNCKYGDKVYYDETLGYNLISGKYYGFCCIEKGQLDEQPKFVYKEDIGKMNWKDAIEKCQEIPNGYLSNRDELKLAYDNGLKNDLSTDDDYWSSTQYDSSIACGIYTYNGYVYNYDKDTDYLVRPFFRIPQIENKVNESVVPNNDLLSFDDAKIEFSKTKTDQVKKNLSNDLDYIKWVDDNFVDLGLPSGTLWCKYNLGATCESTKESWYGDYYAWGELETKERYNNKTYGYKENPSILPLSNDIVYQTYSKMYPWFSYQKIPVMPTYEQIKELVVNTNSELVKNYNKIKGLNGRIFTNKTNDNKLFIPAAGYFFGLYSNLDGDYCYMWSNSIDPSNSDFAWSFSFNSGIHSIDTCYRCNGFSVRGVL